MVGVDVVEVSPPYDDKGEITALLANRAIREAMTGIAMRRQGLTEPNFVHPYALGEGLDSQGRRGTAPSAPDDRTPTPIHHSHRTSEGRP